ncbi:MAG TPA: hypothetical protein P5571_13815 [Candidatus Krumholzibacteria bacterium]|nr:hypothetical protein [Candidatus Krumholzibacteria bacterium]HRX52442.1 hypothetical protein [Candidatus Krumholzibacteria bacterium]
MKTLLTLLTLAAAAALLPADAAATVPGTGFDAMPPGPYPLPGAVIQGDPARVQVVPVSAVGGSAPPGATGNVLVIDNLGGTSPVIVRFTFTCDGPTVEDICQIEYDFFYEAWAINAWIGVYVDDDGTYTDPDDLFEPPVGFPPSTSWGDNTEREPDCVGEHTIDFVVGPDAVAFLDNFDTECLEPVGDESTSWGALKGMYR